MALDEKAAGGMRSVAVKIPMKFELTREGTRRRWTMARSRCPVLALILLALGSLAAEAAEPAKEPSEEIIRLEQVVVTATRTEQRLKDVPANVTVLTKEDIKQSAAQTVDDLLRQIPGFSLFRRSSSLVTHPVSYTHLTLPTTPYV